MIDTSDPVLEQIVRAKLIAKLILNQSKAPTWINTVVHYWKLEQSEISQ